MLLSLYLPVTYNPSRAVTLQNIGVPHSIGVPYRVTYPSVGCANFQIPVLFDEEGSPLCHFQTQKRHRGMKATPTGVHVYCW